MSKGSTRRPREITAQEEADRWAQTFPPKPKTHANQTTSAEETHPRKRPEAVAP